MRAPRFYVDGPISEQTPICVQNDRAHYLQSVLRLRKNDQLKLFNGNGDEWNAFVISANRRELYLMPESRSGTEAFSTLRIGLGIGISRRERMDWIVQKSTELGVDSIHPLKLTRSQWRGDSKRVANRMRHWHSVIVDSCEQCGRNRLPTVNLPTDLATWLQGSAAGLRLLLSPNEAKPPDLTGEVTNIALLVGPEGGLTDDEYSEALSAGFQAWQLGRRILRTETAPVVALSILQYRFGDLGPGHCERNGTPR